MNEPVCRRTLPADENALRRIWQEAYPGDEPYADIFFEMHMHAGTGYAAEIDGVLCSMIFCLKDFTFYMEEKAYQTSYLFALGTAPSFRGRGAAGRLTSFAVTDACQNGNDLVGLMPASDSLAGWYKQDLKAEEMFFHRSFFVDAAPGKPCLIRRLTAEDYLVMRESLLHRTPHTKIPGSVLCLQEAYCRLDGGGLYQIEYDGQTGICTADAADDMLMIRELLFPSGDPEDAARALMQKIGCSRAKVRTPAFWHRGLGKVKPDCLRLPGGGNIFTGNSKPYWGLFLD